MARVTAETVEHVAKLAHVSLTDDERATFARQLEEILEYAESIQELDTSGVEPMTSAGVASGFREDTPGASLARDKALAPAPDPSDGFFRVPRVLPG
jgi:aspartyl-tRNA(Asn)/glutamyl-tRNA(Gln) amidotransferase subunit C